MIPKRARIRFGEVLFNEHGHAGHVEHNPIFFTKKISLRMPDGSLQKWPRARLKRGVDTI